ncbi:hypothetical protein [Aureimonas sp. D3]|uniref:hypothetical protein n=1 Tax=Aureimonas sp. D3 TaxID=1638164 RepID=UPI000B2EDF25|nr:hypothetical protein [Aureimonas sp. D3]
MTVALNKIAPLCAETALNKVAPLSNDLTLAIEDIASAMGLTARALMRKHKRLSKDHGFPPPLPGGVWRWSRAAFEAWVRANGVPAQEDEDRVANSAANDRSSRLVSEQNKSLRARYGAA